MPPPSLANRTLPLVATASLFLVATALALKFGILPSKPEHEVREEEKDQTPPAGVTGATAVRVDDDDSNVSEPRSPSPADAPGAPPPVGGDAETNSIRWQPIPDAAAQKSAIVFVRDAFQNKIDRSTSPKAKRALAGELIAIGTTIQDDAAARFVLFRLARNLGVESGDAATVIDAINTTAESFDIDALPVKASALGSVAKSVQTEDDRTNFFAYSWQTIDEAVKADRFRVALQTVEAATELARGVNDAKQLDQLQRQDKLLKVQAEEFKQFEAAVSTLLEDPDSPTLNLTAGRYLCFEKGDWLHGLPMLAKTDELEIKRAAAADLATPQQTDEQKTVGDAWWKLASRENKSAERQIQRRAVYWYQQALPESAGLSKRILTTRIAEFSGREADTPLKPAREVAVRRPEKELVLGSAYDSRTIVGSFEVTWRAISGASGKTTYAFEKDGTAKVNNRNVGMWKRNGKKIQLTFADGNQGAVLITLPNKETLLGQHKTPQGNVTTWFGRRMP